MEEYFSAGQKGSSAMPHKRNPITGEKLSGLARILRGNAMAALENVPLWHERDISHSSVERVIMPDSCILLDYMLVSLRKLVDRLLVYPENMERNLRITKGLYHSQTILLKLTERGLERKAAYEAVQRAAMATWQGEKSLEENLALEPEITAQILARRNCAALLARSSFSPHRGNLRETGNPRLRMLRRFAPFFPRKTHEVSSALCSMNSKIVHLLVAGALLFTACDKVKLPKFGKAKEATPAPSQVLAAAPPPPVLDPAPPPSVAEPPPPTVNTHASVIVLCYHRFEEQAKDLVIKPAEFESEMQEIKDNGFTVIPMRDFLAWRRSEKEIPEKACIITLDDGWRSQYDIAWPILKKFKPIRSLSSFTPTT